MKNKKRTYKLICEAYIKYAGPKCKSLGQFMKENKVLIDTIILTN